MKNILKILGAVFVLTMCFAVTDYPVIHTSLPSDSDNFSSHTNRNQFSSDSNGFFYHAIQVKNTVFHLQNFSGTNFKNQSLKIIFHKFWGLIDLGEQLFRVWIFQYENFSKNFPVKYGKTDIIFPFHYFW